MKLPKIYEYFKKGQIFTIEDARTHLGTTGNTLRKRLSELAARGYIYPIRQGLYRLHKIEERLERKPSPAPFAIASRLTPECYIGFKSALQLHAKQMPMERETIYVVSFTKFNSFHFENRYYFWCQNPDPHGIETHTIKNHEMEYDIRATNFEKSLIDCLKRPAHCPILKELILLCYSVAPPDLEKIFYYATNTHVKTIFNRLGFVLERMQNKWAVPESLLHSIEYEMSKKQTDWPILMDFQHMETHLPEGRLRWKIKFNHPTTQKNFI